MASTKGMSADRNKDIATGNKHESKPEHFREMKLTGPDLLISRHAAGQMQHIYSLRK